MEWDRATSTQASVSSSSRKARVGCEAHGFQCTRIGAKGQAATNRNRRTVHTFRRSSAVVPMVPMASLVDRLLFLLRAVFGCSGERERERERERAKGRPGRAEGDGGRGAPNYKKKKSKGRDGARTPNIFRGERNATLLSGACVKLSNAEGTRKIFPAVSPGATGVGVCAAELVPQRFYTSRGWFSLFSKQHYRRREQAWAPPEQEFGAVESVRDTHVSDARSAIHRNVRRDIQIVR